MKQFFLISITLLSITQSFCADGAPSKKSFYEWLNQKEVTVEADFEKAFEDATKKVNDLFKGESEKITKFANYREGLLRAKNAQDAKKYAGQIALLIHSDRYPREKKELADEVFQTVNGLTNFYVKHVDHAADSSRYPNHKRLLKMKSYNNTTESNYNFLATGAGFHFDNESITGYLNISLLDLIPKSDVREIILQPIVGTPENIKISKNQFGQFLYSLKKTIGLNYTLLCNYHRNNGWSWNHLVKGTAGAKFEKNTPTSEIEAGIQAEAECVLRNQSVIAFNIKTNSSLASKNPEMHSLTGKITLDPQISIIYNRASEADEGEINTPKIAIIPGIEASASVSGKVHEGICKGKLTINSLPLHGITTKSFNTSYQNSNIVAEGIVPLNKGTVQQLDDLPRIVVTGNPQGNLQPNVTMFLGKEVDGYALVPGIKGECNLFSGFRFKKTAAESTNLSEQETQTEMAHTDQPVPPVISTNNPLSATLPIPSNENNEKPFNQDLLKFSEILDEYPEADIQNALEKMGITIGNDTKGLIRRDVSIEFADQGVLIKLLKKDGIREIKEIIITNPPTLSSSSTFNASTSSLDEEDNNQEEGE